LVFVHTLGRLMLVEYPIVARRDTLKPMGGK